MANAGAARVSDVSEPVLIDEDAYDSEREAPYGGWCPDCRDFTAEVSSPVSVGQRCPDCDGRCVAGAVAARRGGFIRVEREVLR